VVVAVDSLNFIYTHAFEIIGVVGAGLTGMIGILKAFLNAQRKHDDLLHQQFEESINALTIKVESLEKDTVRTKYLDRIDEEIARLDNLLSAIADKFETKEGVREMENRLIQFYASSEQRILDQLKRMEDKLDSKVDISTCTAMMRG
jgi:hypothetical protein